MKKIKDVYDIKNAPCSLLVKHVTTGKTSIPWFYFGDLNSDVKLEKLFSSFDENEYVVRGANLNGHRMPNSEVSGKSVSEVVAMMKEKGNTDEYFPNFYIVRGNFIDEYGNEYWAIECCGGGKPYVYPKKPWAPSYYSPTGQHFHARRIYRLEEVNGRIVAVLESDSGKSETIALTMFEEDEILHAIETGEGLMTHL